MALQIHNTWKTSRTPQLLNVKTTNFGLIIDDNDAASLSNVL